MTTWFFALYTFLVMILAGPVHQESLAGPLMGLLRGPTAAQKIISDRRLCTVGPAEAKSSLYVRTV